jgi:phosphate transport system substrate-binding protein
VKRSLTARAAVPAALVLTLGMSACGAANESDAPAASGSGSASESTLSGTLSGAGASSQTAAMTTWIAAFTDTNPDVTVNYDPSGSGAGRDQFIAGAVPFAGSDRAFKTDELPDTAEACNGGQAMDLPVYVSPIAVVYNLAGVDDLQLSPETTAKIFNQQITTWNDPAIAADNPGATLPATAITPVNRSDDSGTTENFTDYLAQAAPSDWTYPADGEWPVSGGESAQGTSGVISAVQAGDGAIGYADLSQAGDLGVAKIKVGEEYVEPTAETAAAALEASPEEEGREEGDIAIEVERTTDESGAYPIILVSYMIVCSSYEDAAQGDLVKAFAGYVASSEGQEAAASAAGSAPLPESLATEVASSIESITAG